MRIVLAIAGPRAYALPMTLKNFDADAFLRDAWQRTPLLIRGAWDHWRNPLDPDALAGLACEDHVESRLITQARKAFRVEPGPIPETRFGTLGKAPWTLLVQAVDHHVPDVAALIAPFRFIPNWRIDDVMVSYASDGGGVGPHFDQYDVFLVQGLGRRRWQVGALCDDKTELLPHDDLRLLANFEPTEEWLLEPGDMLYVPPRFAHNGVAVGDDCMTYSIGFRAPSRSELIAHYVDDVLGRLSDDDRYADAALALQANPGEITADALARLHDMVLERLTDRNAFARWFGEYNSTPKNPDIDWAPEAAISVEELCARLAAGEALHRNPASRFSFVRQEEGVLLFVDGECVECKGEVAAFAEALCDENALVVTPPFTKSEAGSETLVHLINQGSVAFAQTPSPRT
jgi:50S ribosomal protein L16 3-hydroxylase